MCCDTEPEVVNHCFTKTAHSAAGIGMNVEVANDHLKGQRFSLYNKLDFGCIGELKNIDESHNY